MKLTVKLGTIIACSPKHWIKIRHPRLIGVVIAANPRAYVDVDTKAY